MAKRVKIERKKTTFTKFDPRKILKAARYSRVCWTRCIEGAQNLQNARDYLRAAEAASEVRSKEYKAAESALLNLVRGEIMSSFDGTPQRIPHRSEYRDAQTPQTIRPTEWNTAR